MGVIHFEWHVWIENEVDSKGRGLCMQVVFFVSVMSEIPLIQRAEGKCWFST